MTVAPDQQSTRSDPAHWQAVAAELDGRPAEEILAWAAATFTDGLVATVDLDAVAPETCTLAGRDLYLYLPNGMGRAALPVALEKAGRKQRSPGGTSRNWNTVRKLQEMLHG